MNEENEKIVFDLVKKPLKSEREEKRIKILGIIVKTAICLLLFITGFGLGFIIPRRPSGSNYKFTNVLEQVEYILSNRYLYTGEEDTDEFLEDLHDKVLSGMTSFEDDPYTVYMSRKELEAFYSGINQSFVGVGVQYMKVNDAAVITKVFVDSPAERAGLMEGDLIREIDGISIADMTVDEIKELAIGEDGSEVKITVERDSRNLIISVIRGPVDYTVTCQQVDDYLYMTIESFGMNTGKEIMSYLDKYDDVKKIIIDIRDNGGGFQTSVAEVCGLFIGNEEVYLQQEDNKGNRFVDVTKCDKTYSFDNIVILVNKNTASAAEVFAICMKEKSDVAKVVGTTTYGKGVIQNTVNLMNGGSLKFTDYYWYSPEGTSIHKTGVEPDVYVENDEIWTAKYVDMADDEKYIREDVSDVIALCQKCLETIGYEPDHTNGYFDETLENIILEIQKELGMEENGILTKEIYETILSNAIYVMRNDGSKDKQLLTAMEMMHENHN